MRKILPFLLVAVLLLSGLSVVPVSCQETDSEIISINSSNIKIVHKEIQTQKLDDNYNFIVLTANQFMTALQPLISHKNARGLSTKLVTLDEIYNGVFFSGTRSR